MIIAAVRKPVEDDAIRIPLLDLEIYFRAVDFMDDKYASAILTEKNVTSAMDGLMEIARNDDYSIRPLSDILGFPKEEELIYVATNEKGFYGAGILAFPHILAEKVKEMGMDDVYILPSSVHEVLIVPRSLGTYEELSFMIKGINESEVKPNERLSDHPYLFDATSAVISMEAGE